MSALWEWCYWRNRAHNAESELKDLRAAYNGMVAELRREKDKTASLPATLQQTLLALTDANDREAALGRQVADLEQHVECMAIDNMELQKVVDAYTQGLRWFEGSET